MKTSQTSQSVIPSGSISHHLRSPLASLQAQLLILERAAGSERGTIEKLHEKVNLLAQRIDQVTEYHRLQQNFESTYSFFCVGDVVRELSVKTRIQIRGNADVELMADRVLVRDLLCGISAVFSQDVSLTVSESEEKAEVMLRFSGSLHEENGSSEQSVENMLLYATSLLALTHLHGTIEERVVKKARELRVVLPKSRTKK